MRIYVLVVFLSLHLRNLSCYDDIDDDSGKIKDKSETDHELEPESENMDTSDCDTGTFKICMIMFDNSYLKGKKVFKKIPGPFTILE